MNKTKENRTYISCWIEGIPKDVEQLKSAIIENRGDAFVRLWDHSNLELTDLNASEKAKEKVGINGKVYAATYDNGIADTIFVTKGEPYEYEEDESIKMIHAHFAICASWEILNPIKLKTRSDELGYNMEYCRPANQEEVDLLKRVLYEHDLAWDAEKEQLVERKKQEAWKPEEGEICWVCYNHGEGYNFKPMLMEYDNGYSDKLRKGWVFKRKQECQLMCDKLNNALFQATINEQQGLWEKK